MVFYTTHMMPYSPPRVSSLFTQWLLLWHFFTTVVLIKTLELYRTRGNSMEFIWGQFEWWGWTLKNMPKSCQSMVLLIWLIHWFISIFILLYSLAAMGSVFASDRVFSVVDHLVAIFPFPEQREGTFTRMKVLDFTSHTTTLISSSCSLLLSPVM